MTKRSTFSGTINTIQEISSIAKERGVAHLYTEDQSYNGRIIQLNSKETINFGSCSYLGLETDQRIKDGAIDAIQRYGSQFACSRSYVSCTIYREFEEVIGKMFNAPLLLSPTTSMGHAAVMPIVIEDTDAVILDHQAHYSMQDVVKKLQVRGIEVTYLRHNRLDELKLKIKELSKSHSKIWYVIDGVYSMYGDVAPLQELYGMLEEFKQLWLYIDDAHGVSWAGKNGTGYALSQISLHQKMIFTTSLGKGFANAGGVFVFPSEEMQWRVKNWGGPLTHSGPQPPSVIGACIASAKIHLSSEIYVRQEALAERIKFCNSTFKKYGLPLIAESVSPVFFVGLGLTKVSYNMVKRLINEGIYVNLAVFPAVPETCAGIRFTLTLHHTFEDIENLAKAIAYHLPIALEEEQRTIKDIHRAFRTHLKEPIEKNVDKGIQHKENLILQKSNSIFEINQNEWNSLFSDNGPFDYNALLFLENNFKNNIKPWDNWNFYYYIVKSERGEILAATFFTVTLSKDDILSPVSISKNIEQKRKNNPEYFTTRTFMMGSNLSDGNHLYLKKKNINWKKALSLIIDEVWKDQDKEKASMLLFRDFPEGDLDLRDFFIDRGFIKIELPETHYINNIFNSDCGNFIEKLGHKKRYHLKKDVLSFEKLFDARILKNINEKEINHIYKLYQNVKENNLEINSFPLPRKLFYNISKSSSWEIIALYLKDSKNKNLPVAVGLVYKNKNYCPLIIGLDYNYQDLKIYKQILYQTILRAVELKYPKIFLGITSSLEKRKLNAIAIKNVGYMQVKDNFNLSLLDLMPQMKETSF